MTTIVTLTLNPALDLGTAVDRVVAEDKLRCEEPTRHPGGGGINVARAATRLGTGSRAVFPAGGPTGDALCQQVEDEGVTVERIDTGAETRQNVSVTETTTDRQFRFVLPGAPLRGDELDRCLGAVEDAASPDGLVVASGSIPPGVDEDVYARLIGACPDVRVVVDTSGPALRHAIDAGAWLVKPNLRELAELVGKELDGDPEVIQAARSLLGGGTQAVVVSLGAGGAMLVTSDDEHHVRSPTVPVRSRVGAGDSSVAGIVVGVLRGDDLHTAVRYGVAAGAAAVMTEGSELCRRDDVDRLFAELA